MNNPFPDKEYEALAQERAKVLLDIPRFAVRHVCEVAGITPTTIRNWLTRGVVILAADSGREMGKWRYFTGADALRLAAVQEFTRLHLPIEWGNQLAGAVVDYFRHLLTHVSVIPINPFFVAHVRDGDLMVSGPLDTDSLPGLAGDGSDSLGIFFKPLEIVEPVCKALGFTIAQGAYERV